MAGCSVVSDSMGLLTSVKSMISFAKIIVLFLDQWVGKSAIIMLNNVEFNGEPCGSPFSTILSVESFLPILTLMAQSDKKFFDKTSIWPVISSFFIL